MRFLKTKRQKAKEKLFAGFKPRVSTEAFKRIVEGPLEFVTGKEHLKQLKEKLDLK